MSNLVKCVQSGSLEVLCEELSNIGIFVNTVDIESALQLFNSHEIPIPFDTFDNKAKFINGWKNVLNNWSHQPTSIRLISCVIALSNFATSSDRQRIAGMLIPLSKNEAAIRGFSICFFHGRKTIGNRLFRDQARLAIEESFKLATYVTDSDSRMERIKKFRGQLGVGKLFLARGRSSEKPIDLLESALSDLELSRKYGDETPNHYAYEIETIARILEIKHSQDLELKGIALAEKCQIVIPQLAYSIGDFYLSCAISKAEIYNQLTKETETLFDGSIDTYSQGIKICESKNEIPNSFISKRGYAKLRKCTVFHQADSIDILNSIIDDLKYAKPNYYTGFNPLPTALFWRAQFYIKSDEYDKAIIDLELALSKGIPKGANPDIITQISRIKLELVSCKLQRSIQHNIIDEIVEYLSEIISYEAKLDPKIPLISNAIKSIAENGLIDDHSDLVRNSISKMFEIRALPHCIGETRAFASSYIAGAIMRLKNNLTIPELRTACQLYAQVESISEDDLPAEHFGLAANAKLRLSKLLRESGVNTFEPKQLLEEACNYFEISKTLFPEDLDVITKRTFHSKLGETYLRLHSYTYNHLHLENSISNLELSLRLGNLEPELIGLLGDGYYRYGTFKQNLSFLKKALAFKDKSVCIFKESENKCQPLRENYSLSSKINYLIWEITQNENDLMNSINFVLKAIKEDDNWPWPYFQLVEYSESITKDVFLKAINDLNFQLDHELTESLLKADFESLKYFGANKAALNTEFEQEVLGGRLGGVYLLDDPHRLLSKSIVLKRGSHSDILRDSKNTGRFANFLKESKAPIYFRTPRLLGVVDRHVDSVYVMTLEKGIDLGSIILDSSISHEKCLNYTLKAAKLLAYFHAWAWKMGLNRMDNARISHKRVMKRSVGWFKKVGVEEILARKMLRFSDLLSSGEQLLFLKKDAHPENWIIGFDGAITVIDFENSACLPILFDLCQLIDDFPLTNFDENGLSFRRLSIETYIESLYTLAPDLEQKFRNTDLERTYYSNLVVRTAFGMGRIALKIAGESDVSSSALKGNRERFNHYVKSANWLAKNFKDDLIGQAGNMLMDISKSILAKIII